MNQRLIVLALVILAGCGGSQKKEDPGFFTSGNRDADQRAEQRMAKAEQTNSKQETSSNKPSGKAAAEDTKKLTLYERLGGEKGIKAVVEDFVPRAIADPRVNFERKGITKGGLSIHRNESVQWDPSGDHTDKLKQHLAEFFAVATGGPSQYGGREMKEVHAGMHITNPEFDAAVGDLKATLDKLQVPNPEQKELLAIVETTRPQVVEER
jgi:truncated hemoglobin YjbI